MKTLLRITRRLPKWMFSFGVLFLVFLSFCGYLTSGFNWIDHNDIEYGFARIAPGDTWARVFSGPFGRTSFYRPLVTILNSIDYSQWGLWPTGYHLTNLSLHLLAVYLVGLMFQRVWLIPLRYAWLGALVFGVHPVVQMIIGLVTFRQEAIVTIGILATLLLYIQFRYQPSMRSAVGVGATFFLSMLAKETAVIVVPLVLFWWEITKGPRIKKRDSLPVFLAIAAGFLMYILLRYRVAPFTWSTNASLMSVSERVGTTLALLWHWFVIVPRPFGGSLTDVFPILNIGDIGALSGVGILVMGGVFVYRKGLRSQEGSMAMFVLLLFVGSINLVPVPRVASPHYMYLPVIGFAIISMKVIHALSGGKKKFGIVLVFLWITLAMWSDQKASRYFQNDYELFSHELSLHRVFPEAHYYLGIWHLGHKNIPLAEKHFRESVIVPPGTLAYVDTTSSLLNLSSVLILQQRYDEAEKYLQEILPGASPERKASVVYNLALVARAKQDNPKIVEILWPERLHFNRKEPLLLLSETLHTLGAFSQEKEVLELLVPYLGVDERLKLDRYRNEL